MSHVDILADHPAAHAAASAALTAVIPTMLPQVRDVIAVRAVTELVILRQHHGMGYMAILAGRADLRVAVGRRVWAGDNPESRAAIDKALAAAARVLAEG